MKDKKKTPYRIIGWTDSANTKSTTVIIEERYSEKDAIELEKFYSGWPNIQLVAKKKIALTLIYLRQTNNDNRKLKTILSLCTGIFFSLGWKYSQINLSMIATMLLGLISLLIIKEQLQEYRIRKGLFGTNRTEARALIEFIIKNSEDIDFTDSNGKLRCTLLPETEPTTAEQALPAFGEEATA